MGQTKKRIRLLSVLRNYSLIGEIRPIPRKKNLGGRVKDEPCLAMTVVNAGEGKRGRVSKGRVVDLHYNCNYYFQGSDAICHKAKILLKQVAFLFSIHMYIYMYIFSKITLKIRKNSE